jgi:N-acetylglucosamine transport system substrate-binding protein
MSDTNGKIAPFVYPGVVGGYYGYLVSQWWTQSAGIEGVKQFYRFEDVSVYDYKKQPRKGLYEALEAFDSVFGSENTKYSLRGSMSKNHTEAQLAFLRGEAAMIPNASWLECEMKEDIPEGFVLKLMPAPFIETAQKDENGEFKKVSYGCHPDYMIIAKSANNVAGAKKFLAFTSSEEMIKLFTKYTGTLRPFEYDYMSLYDEVSPFVQSCMDIYNGSDWFMESSPSKMYKKGLVDVFLTQIPFPALVYGPNNGGTTVDRFMKAEYLKATEEWDTLVSKL